MCSHFDFLFLSFLTTNNRSSQFGLIYGRPRQWLEVVLVQAGVEFMPSAWRMGSFANNRVAKPTDRVR